MTYSKAQAILSDPTNFHRFQTIEAAWFILRSAQATREEIARANFIRFGGHP